ncbi:hypothetical protein SISSUDRAFT_696854 [Sistotremastrum suecicum HHB10207 ss-3]|uniref:HAT C-terminal dimerisation domain-containing protein n=1 Tax=Sistotremastrum suecicum HHB10207 ss-3 TaxID=1314776 RepID=A0A166DX23_9AGAM|nr:hypothetical protein SISSUDRAFT_696854 [Sistotremastrum suecicum HHB10207 ss-3]
MVVELELRIREAGWQWSSKRWRIRCMAHVINLATQALLKSLSKAPHFNPHDPDAHLPEGDAESRRDVIGLVRAISVKERSSSQRKELFADIQNTMHESPSASTTANKTTTTAGAVRVYRLILDMPVRWSSTHAMLYRSFMLKECVTSFIQILYIRETDTAKKAGLAKLQMQASDWAEVKEYYDRAADSDTSLFAILLDPTQKDKHFRQHWGAALHAKAIAAAKEIFKARYEEMEVKGQLKPTITNTIKATKVQALIDFSEFDATPTTAPETPASTSGDSLMDKAFNKYLYGEDEMMGGQTVVEWWGVSPVLHCDYFRSLTIVQANQARYPVWASLAADYLPMQASSVASERAFSSAGITITKRRNRLQGDIVEALQVLKSLYRRNLMKGSDNPTLENEWQLEKNYQEAEQEEEEVEARIEEVQEVDEEDINLAVEVDCASDSDWEDI